MDSKEYGYVLATIGAGLAANFYMMVRVGKARKSIGLDYPKVYADGDSPEEKKFNCTQRAHQNHVEQAPMVYTAVAILGSKKPVTAASLGAVYTLARLMYFHGYSSGDPSKRAPGAIVSLLTTLGVAGTAIYTGLTASGLL